MGQPQRLAIPGILFIIYSIGMAVAAVRNFKVYKTDCDLSNRLLKNPAQTLTEVINLFRNVEENNRLSKSISGLDSFNIFFRFYKVGKYVEKYDCINNYLAENSEPLEYIMRSYGGNVTGEKISDDELLKQQAAFSAQPVNNYQKNLKFKLRAIVVGVILVILIPILISLNSTMRNSENKDKPGKNPAESSVTQQNSSASVTEGISSNESTPKQYTAEEFINKYNYLASNFPGVVDTFDFSKGTKKTDEDGKIFYSFVDDDNKKALSLYIDSNSEKVLSVCMSFSITGEDNPIYRYDVANAVTVFINNLPLADALAVCDKTVEKGKYTDQQISGIVLYYEKDSSANMENWLIFLSDSVDINEKNYQSETKSASSSKQDNESSIIKSNSETSSKSGKINTNSQVSKTESSANSSTKSQKSEVNTVSRTPEPQESSKTNQNNNDNEMLERERIRLLNESKTNAERLMRENFNKNNYRPEQQNEIENIIQKYMGQINNAATADRINQLYAYAINELNNVKTIQQLEEESAQAVPAPEYYNETLYADKLFNYNGITYYTPAFSGKGDTGYLDFSALGATYRALTLPKQYDRYGRQIDIDSFIIVNDVVYFTDQSPGSISPLPSKLYKMNIDGSNCILIADDVDVRFYYSNQTVYFAAYYSSDDSYTYSTLSGEKKYIGKRISLDNSDMILYGYDRVEYDGGIYYKENLVYYREDKATGNVQVIGHSVGGGQQ